MFDPILLASFKLVAETRSFSEAARRLNLRQPTVSQHVARLEQSIGRRLFVRDTHSVTPTADGDALLAHAEIILQAHDRARRHFAAAELRGRVRFGTSEDFVTSRLPALLRDFTRRHPAVDLELVVALSGRLVELYDAGQLDLALGKRRLGDERGRLIRREALAWVGNPLALPDAHAPLPLLLFPEPSISRKAVLDALARAGRAWRIVCTSGSLTGLIAAAEAGLGVTAQARSLISRGLSELPPELGLPDLGELEFTVLGADRPETTPAGALAALISANTRWLQTER
ncbi:MAG: LysR family transcriptional regulator [Aliidongia sp.]|jgi:DNA-binding transcriptional LysR family regulator